MKKVLISLVLLLGLVSVPAVSSNFNASELMPADMLEKELQVEELSQVVPSTKMSLQSDLNRGRCHRGRCDDDRGRHRPRPPRRRPPSHPYEYICYAESASGHWYSSIAHRPEIAQRWAMDMCYRNHRRCYQAGCRAH